MKRYIEQAQRVLSIPSTTAKGNEELVNHLATLVQGSGLEVKLQHVLHSYENLSRRQLNLVGILGDPLVDRKISTGLLLLSHLDTAPSGRPQSWVTLSGEPFKPKIAIDGSKKERIVGLGATHAKLDFLCKLRAVQKYREAKLKMPIYLVGTCGAEFGQMGARYLIQSHALNPRFVLVGAPTDLKVVYAHKSSTEVKVNIGFHTLEKGARGYSRKVFIKSIGRTHHSAFPKENQSAFLNLMKLLNRAMDNGFDIRLTSLISGESPYQIPDGAEAECYLTSHQLEDFKRFFVEHRERLMAQEPGISFEIELGGLGETGISFLPQTWFQSVNEILKLVELEQKDLNKHLPPTSDSYDPPGVTIAVTHVVQNTGRTELHLDWRLLPEQKNDEIIAAFSRKIFEIGTQFKSLNLKAEIIRSNPSFHYQESHPWIKTCGEAMDRAGLLPNLDSSSLCTEAGLFAQAGFEVAVFGPGLAKTDTHAPDESVLMEDLERATVFYEKVIEKVCL